MPTGYTAPIYEGEKYFTFEKFAMRCARYFGACISMREEPLDAEIDLDKHFQPSDYYKDALQTAEKAYQDFLDNPPTEEQLGREYDEITEKNRKEFLEKKADYEQMMGRYRDMLRATKQWIPPTPEHNNLKDFMVQQLEDSLKFDCRLTTPHIVETREEYIKYYMSSERFTEEIDYCRSQYEKEVMMCNERKKWIMDLMDSLKGGNHGSK